MINRWAIQPLLDVVTFRKSAPARILRSHASPDVRHGRPRRKPPRVSRYCSRQRRIKDGFFGFSVGFGTWWEASCFLQKPIDTCCGGFLKEKGCGRGHGAEQKPSRVALESACREDRAQAPLPKAGT
jgi:hypothetical protein